MPHITNPEYYQAVVTKEIELKGLNKLDEWIAQIPYTKRPRKATETHCKVLLILLYYLGCRPAELLTLKPQDFNKIELPAKEGSPSVKAYQITIVTLKKGKTLRNLTIPINNYTAFCYNAIKKQYPTQDFFYSFKSRTGATKNKVKWAIKKDKQIIGYKERLYFQKGNLIKKYITKLTGLPPYFFRHHRQTWMDEKGASIQEQADWKGGTIKSASIYRSMTGEKKKKQLKYF